MSTNRRGFWAGFCYSDVVSFVHVACMGVNFNALLSRCAWLVVKVLLVLDKDVR